MKDRSYALVIMAGLFAVIAAAVWMIRDRSRPVAVELPPKPLASIAPAPAPLSSVAVAISAPPIPPDLPPPKPRIVPSPEALRDIEEIQFMLRDYRTRLGDNPTGTNAEIMKEVIGGNRFRAKFGPPEGQKLNEQGELLDRWEVPYFFHQLSKNEMEVRSAGPDRTMWTADDVVMK
jgi:hypothetical protein